MLLAVFVCGASAIAAYSQQTQQPVFRGRIDLVQVDVVVLDADDRPVNNLRAEDFTLLDRGEPQQVELFREVNHQRPPKPEFPETLGLDVADNITAAADRLVVIVIDDLHFQGKTDEVKAVARRVVSELGQSASMALLTTSRTVGVEFTEDRSVLLRAIDRFNDRFDPEGRAISPGLRKALATPNLFSGRPTRGPGPGDLGMFFSDMQAFRTLEEAAGMLGVENRLRKAFVWISSGVRGGSDGDPTDDEAGTQAQDIVVTDYYGMGTAAALNAMRRANVATYALDPGGYGANGRSLSTIAGRSGGFVISRDAIEPGLNRLLADLDNYYLLGFYPRDPDPKDGRYRPLEVRVNRPGLTVRSRRGYTTAPPRPLPKNDSYLVALSASVMPSTTLPMRVFAAPFPSSGRDTRVLLTIEVPASRQALQARADTRSGLADRLHYAVLAADLKKLKVTRTLENRATIAVPPDGDGGGADGITYQIVTDLKLPPGPYQLRASARSDTLGLGGSVYLTFDATDFTKTALGVGGIVIGLAGGAPAHVLSNVAERKLVPFTPVLDREFERGQALEVLAPIYRKNARTEIALALEVVGRADAIVSRVDQRIGLGARPELRTTLPLAALAPGPYRLRVTAADGVNSSMREVGIVVR